MGQKAAVVRATLGSTLNATTDFTSSGFGTVSAAIIIGCSACTAENPATNAIFHVGFWDGTNQCASTITAIDGGATAVTARMSDDSYALMSTGPSGWTASAITDGIRLTLNPDATSVDRYCTVILLSGISAKVLTFTPNATQNSTQASASLGFAPKLVFFTTIGNTAADTASGTLEAQISFGFAADDSTQRMVAFSSKHSAANEDATLQYSETRAVGQVNSGSLVWSGEVTTFGADTFTMTTRDGGTSSDVTFALALGGDALSFDTGTLTTLTSTGTAVVATGIVPDAVLAMLSTATSTTIAADSTANGFTVGLTDDTNEYSHSVYVEDNAATIHSGSVATATNFIDLDSSSGGSRSDLVTGTVAFDNDSFDINYSAVSGTARKGWWVAFGGLLHTTTGTLVGPGTTVAGTATHPGIHPSSGVLAGAGSTLNGTAQHRHQTTGVLVGAGSEVIGVALHRHQSTGVLVGAGAELIGSAVHWHGATGVLVGDGASIVGTVNRHFQSTGELVGAGSILTAAAQRHHAARGVLVGDGSTIVSTAERRHRGIGILIGAGSSLAGAAEHWHAATGAVVGAGAVVTGEILHQHSAGALVGDGAIVIGECAHWHTMTGVLVGSSTLLAGIGSIRGPNGELTTDWVKESGVSAGGWAQEFET
jgi:hypothetical protein